MSELESGLAASGRRLTRARRTVLRVLSDASVPLSPREITAVGRQHYGHLGLVTVYRTLELLELMHWVRRVHGADGCHGYMLCGRALSPTLVCRLCGRVAEFPGGQPLRSLIDRVQADTGFRVDDPLVQLSGLCPACQGASGADEADEAAHRENGSAESIHT